MHGMISVISIFAMLLVLMLSQPVLGDEIIFSDDFSDGDAEGWLSTVGEWGISGDFYCAEACTSCGGVGYANTVDVFTWDEGFSISGKMKFYEIINNYGRSICLFSEDYDDAVCVEYRASISELCIDVLVNWGLAVHECIEIEESEWNGSDGEWHEFTMRLSGDFFEVFKDGKDIFVVQNDSLVNFSNTVFVRLGVQNCLSCFDDIVVTSLGTEYVCGDCDGSGEIDIDDVVYCIAYLFSGGSAPDPVESADVDCSGETDIDDVVYTISYLFTGGPPPCDADNNGEPDC